MADRSNIRMDEAEKETFFINYCGKDETIEFAVSELAGYLSRMDRDKDIVRQNISYGENGKNSISVGLCEELQVDMGSGNGLDEFSDFVCIKVEEGAGYITGINARSVLLGVYLFLNEAGCRWIRPGQSGEMIPVKCLRDINVKISKRAAYRHRGICIEGACSLENVLDMIDWLPKVGFNAYFIQFREGFTFFDRWYSHKFNALLEKESFDVEKARYMVGEIRKEIQKRSLIYHAVGHGWTCEPFGIAGLGWDKKEYDLPPEITRNFALVNGKREIWEGVPLNTNLCYSNSEVRNRVIHEIGAYLEEHGEVDILHFWLADGYNNHCECENCVKVSPSDIYVKMLNELDELLDQKGIQTKVVFLIYVELLWPPLTERIKNPERFILMFAPITRTYSNVFSSDGPDAAIPPFTRNKMTFPAEVEKNLALLSGWKKQFAGDSFDFDYHLWRDHFNDPGYYSISEVINKDVRNLKNIGLNGFVSCQTQRIFFPTALPMYVLGKTLWDDTLAFEELAEDYFRHAFGEDGPLCEKYMSRLSEAFDPVYLRNETEQVSNEAVQRFMSVPAIVKDFQTVLKRNLKHHDPNVAKSWELLEYHAEICTRLAAALASRAKGDHQEAKDLWNALKAYVQENEPALQSVCFCLYLHLAGCLKFE